MANNKSIALDQETTGEVVVVATKDVYKEKGIPCCPGSEAGSGKAVYCIKFPVDSDSVFNERSKILEKTHKDYVNAIGDETIVVGHNKRLRLENPVDFLTYHLLILRDDIAPSQAEYNKTRHIGYFVNEEKESLTFVDNTDKIEKALSYVSNCQAELLPNIAMYCSVPYKGSQNIINGRVRKLAIDNPAKIIEFFENPSLSSIVYIQKLMIEGHIKRINGAYMFDGTVLGTTMAQMISFFNDDKNAVIVEKMNLVCPFQKFTVNVEDKE